MKKDNNNYLSKLDTIVKELCSSESYDLVYHTPHHGEPMPSTDILIEIVDTLKEVLFPGYFRHSSLKPETMEYYIGVNLDKVCRLLSKQIVRGLCFTCEEDRSVCDDCEEKADEITIDFLSRLPAIRDLLTADVKAAYMGDPAAKSYGEVIFCYPTIRALTNYRIGHELLKLNVPIIPRIICEMAHSETGIDIHPGAEIGEYFTIDHGTGVVIGETTIIGNHVKLYQGVTLGAKSFPLDKDGNPIKGIPRHPVVQDNVIIYAESTILGRVTIGENSVIGGNIWITHDVPPNSKIMQYKG